MLATEFHGFNSANPQFTNPGQIDFELAAQDVIELRIPLDVFLGPAPEQIRVSFDWRDADGSTQNMDESHQAAILAVPELQPAFISGADLVGPDSAFCQGLGLGQKTWEQVQGVYLPNGYAAEYFIPPTGLQVPSDVVALPDGSYLVSSSWMTQMIAVSEDGRVKPWAHNYGSYAVDRDNAGQVYGYNSPVGVIVRTVPGADPVVLLHDDSIQTLNESPMTVSPDGTIYVAPNKFFDPEAPDGAYIVELKVGQAKCLEATYDEMVKGLDFGLDGRLYATIGNGLYVLDLVTGRPNLLASLPGGPIFHGLDVGEAGRAYVVLEEKKGWVSLYEVSPDGKLTLFGELEGSPIEGIAIEPGGGVIGAQRNTGGLWHFMPDGSVHAIVEPNYLVTPETMAFAPCGELLVVLEEGGTVGVFTPDGTLTSTFGALTFGAPHFLSMTSEGWFTLNLALPPRIELPFIILLPNGDRMTLSEEIDVRGAVIHEDGDILVTAAREGAIMRYQSDGSHQILLDGLDQPRSLVEGPDGTLYFIEGEHHISAIEPGGEPRRITSFNTVPRLLIMGPDGNLYVSFSNDAVVYQVTPDGQQQRFFSGIEEPFGLAFDALGNLFITDCRGASIVRVRGFETNAMNGRVVSTGADEPLAGVRIIVAQTAYPYAGTTLETDENGAFTVDVVPGVYSIKILEEGEIIAEVEGVFVEADLDIGTIEVSVGE